jgi:hypothetical protein
MRLPYGNRRPEGRTSVEMDISPNSGVLGGVSGTGVDMIDLTVFFDFD